MVSLSSYEHSLANFKASLASLESFVTIPILTDRDKAGVIQAFEYCFELSWKTVQKFSGLQEIQVNGPKQALREAFQFGFIDIEDEAQWFEMLKDRNLTSHTYNYDLAIQVVDRIAKNHLFLLKKLILKLPLK